MGLIERAASELTYLRGFLRLLRGVAPIARHRDRTFRDLADEVAGRYGDRVALLSDTESLTFRQWNGQGNRYGRWAMSAGIGKGDVVALLMPNRPEYCAIWLGMGRIGAVTALLNTNLTGAALAHSINVVGARTAIVDARMLDQYLAAAPLLDHPVTLVVHGAGGGDLPRLDTAAAALSPEPIPPTDLPALTITDRCLYIYTSGTTGRPKAAQINHYRVQLIMRGFAAIANATAEDRVYDALPMYHANGGVIAIGIALVSGGSCFIREKFSATDFWPDMVRRKATMFIYIGELCRYLLHAPPDAGERGHQVRLCIGNGLRPDVWEPFAERFGMRRIIEYYAATEGNCTVVNFDSHPGAVGRVPAWIAHRFPIRLVRFDVESESVVRGADGLCIEVPVGEVGEAIGEILDDPKKPANRFDGYSDRDATQSKILRDVFRKGDAWFRAGDLMRKDGLGYFYFVDRIGDTFRWKGENVATSDVAEAVSGFAGVRDVAVYGVSVPGREGRAGMACIVADAPGAVDMAALPAFLAARLPDYAVPVFLRFSDAIAVTGTFKQRKTELVEAGFDPARVADPLVYRDPTTKAYVPLDAAAAARIAAGTVRF